MSARLHRFPVQGHGARRPGALALLWTLLLGGLPAGAAAAISYVGVRNTSTAAAASSLVLNGPVGLTTGDVMIAAVSQETATANWTPPAGWTTLVTSGTTAPRTVVWYHVATAADTASTSYTFSSSGSGERGGGIMAFRGVDTTAPIAASAMQAHASAVNNSVAPSITPGVANSMLLAIWGFSDSTATVPAAMTASIPHGTGSANANLMTAYQGVSASTATGTRTLSTADGVTSNAVLLALKPAGASTVDHYELSLPTSSLACLPSTVTVTACANSTAPCASASTTVSGQTAALATAGATLGAGTVTFNASGVATTTLQYPAASNGTAVSVTLSGESTAATNARQCCPNGISCSVANSCSTTFNTAGFIVSASANGAVATVPTQTAGTASGTYYLRAVQTSTTTSACAAALTGSTTVNWAYQCNNPTTCSAGNLMSVTGNSATAITGNPNSGVASYTAVPMTFDASGNAPFTFTYNDVGQVTLWATKAVNSATLAGSSNAFVTKPAGFTLTSIRQTASPNLANPGASSAAGAKFVKAGEAFSATVAAVTSGGATTPNFGRETSPEGVLLAPALVLPGGGAAGTLGNATLAGGTFSSGVATATNLSYSEVGIVTLTPSVASGSYLGAGNVSGTVTGNVGRFVPAQFALSGGTVTHRSAQSCAPASAFTYLGENFLLGFALTAQNVAGATMQNYSGSFAKLDPTVASAWNLAGLGGTTTFSTGSGRLALGSAAGSWSNGVASAVTITANATRAATPDGPFSAAFGIAPVDSDGVAMASFNMASTSGGGNDRASVATVALRFGRLRLSNAIGAQTTALSMPLAAQYWSGSYFDTNTLDSCTTVPATAVNFGNLRKTLTSADTVASGANFALASGLGSLKLAAPSGGRYGSADVALSLGSTATDVSCLQTWTPSTAATVGASLAFLRGAFCGSSYGNDPAARASFGLYRGADTVIYQRENY